MRELMTPREETLLMNTTAVESLLLDLQSRLRRRWTIIIIILVVISAAADVSATGLLPVKKQVEMQRERVMQGKQ